MAAEIKRVFSEEQDLVNLLDACGAGQNEMDRIVADGFESMKDLVVHHENDVETFKDYLKTLNKTFNNRTDSTLTVYFPPPVVSRMVGALFYCKICYYSFHVIPDIRNIDRTMATDVYKVYDSLTKDSDADPNNDVDNKIPSLKGASNWRSFRDLVMMRLSFIKGKAGFPILYVVDGTTRTSIRANATRSTASLIDFTDEEIFKTRPVHFGRVYKEDNKRVWNVIKSLLMESPAYDHIISFDKAADGRKAWKTLRAFYEGEDFKQRLQDDAFTILNNSIYKGNSNRNNFESYVNKHLKAHKFLLEAGYNNGLGMDDSTKIQHLKSGIRFEAGLEHALTTARTMGMNRGTFQKFVSFLSAEVDQKNARSKELKANLSATGIGKTTQTKTQNKNVSDNRTKYYENVDGKRVEARSYPGQEWREMTPSQRAAVVRLNKKRKSDRFNNRRADIKSTATRLPKDTIKSISETIIASINKQASEETNNDERLDKKPKVTFDTNNKAQAGQVGKFLSRTRA